VILPGSPSSFFSTSCSFFLQPFSFTMFPLDPAPLKIFVFFAFSLLLFPFSRISDSSPSVAGDHMAHRSTPSVPSSPFSFHLLHPSLRPPFMLTHFPLPLFSVPPPLRLNQKPLKFHNVEPAFLSCARCLTPGNSSFSRFRKYEPHIFPIGIFLKRRPSLRLIAVCFSRPSHLLSPSISFFS